MVSRRWSAHGMSGFPGASCCDLATPAEAADIDVALFGSVPLTGITLDAALKMRCDLTGAACSLLGEGGWGAGLFVST